MTSIVYSPLTIQASAHSVPSTPSWFGEVTLIAHYLTQQGVLAAIEEQVRFARRRFGRYDVIDFVAVLLGYAASGERTLEAFYQRVSPFASAFMTLFGRDRLPARSTPSRFLAALTSVPVEALRALFLSGLLARPPVKVKEGQPGGLWNRGGTYWVVFDVDGTREAARQRALPKSPDRPHAPAPNAGPLRSRLHRSQTRGGRPHSYNRPPSPYSPMARHLWQPGQWSVPAGATPSGRGNPVLSEGAVLAT